MTDIKETDSTFCLHCDMFLILRVSESMLLRNAVHTPAWAYGNAYDVLKCWKVNYSLISLLVHSNDYHKMTLVGKSKFEKQVKNM